MFMMNYIMYIDNLIIFSPCGAGFQHMANICYDYGGDSDADYRKECGLRVWYAQQRNFLIFIWQKLICDETKYLRHFITEQMQFNSISWFGYLFGNYHPSKMYFSVHF